MHTNHLGYVGVDTGTIAITDVCHTTIPAEHAYRIAYPTGSGDHRGHNVISSTPYGDGLFAVLADHDDNGELIRLRIEFDRVGWADDFDLNDETNTSPDLVSISPGDDIHHLADHPQPTAPASDRQPWQTMCLF